MRTLPTAGVIQDYIFHMGESTATPGFRARSALHALLTDICLMRFKEELGDYVEEKGNAACRN
jgi:hypothetical protein